MECVVYLRVAADKVESGPVLYQGYTLAFHFHYILLHHYNSNALTLRLKIFSRISIGFRPAIYDPLAYNNKGVPGCSPPPGNAPGLNIQPSAAVDLAYEGHS